VKHTILIVGAAIALFSSPLLAQQTATPQSVPPQSVSPQSVQQGDAVPTHEELRRMGAGPIDPNAKPEVIPMSPETAQAIAAQHRGTQSQQPGTAPAPAQPASR
jgi:hypothetical protein